MHIVSSLVLSLTAVTALGVAPPAAAAPEPLVALSAPAPDDPDLVRARDRVVDDIEATIRVISTKQDLIWASDLTDEQKYAEAMGTRYDQQGLTALAGSAGEATTLEQVRGYAADLRGFYPHVYDLAVTYLHRANLLGAEITANETALAQLPDGYADQARAANDAARTSLGYPTGTDQGSNGGRAQAADYRTAIAGLATVRRQLGMVRAVLDEARRFSQLQSRALRQADAKRTRLSQVAARVLDSGLPDEQTEALSLTVQHDELTLSDLFSALSAATSLEELERLVPELARYRPQNYDVLLATVGEVPRLDERIAGNRAALAAVTDHDVSAGVTANEAAAAAVGRAAQAAGDLTALSTRSDVDAVRHELAVAREQLRVVRRVLDRVSD